MSGGALHTMRWTYDGDGTKVEAVCHAADGADCRLTSVSCECEHWGEIQRRDDGTIWHNIVEGSETEPQWHEVQVADWCNICLFINESGYAEELTPDGEHHEFILADIPFEPVWENDGCSWRPTAGDRKADPARDPDAVEYVHRMEKCTERSCGTRVRFSELTDDVNTHWHLAPGVGMVPASALADPARDAELRAEGALRERVEAVLREWSSCWCDEEQHRDCPRHGSADCRHMAEGIGAALRAALTEAGGES